MTCTTESPIAFTYILPVMAMDMKNYQLQLSCIILCYSCYVMSIRHLNESDGALADNIKADLKRVVDTVEQVKTASNSIVDGVAQLCSM